MELDFDKEKLNPVLTVLGQVSKDDAAVLRAGMRKILASLKAALIVDFSAAEASSEATEALLAVHGMAIEKKLPVVMVGKHPDFCQVSNIQDGQKLCNPVDHRFEMASVKVYERVLEHLARERQTAAKKLEKAAEEIDLEELKTEKRRLLSLIEVLAKHAERTKKNHRAPRRNDALNQKITAASDQLLTTLKGMGIAT